MSQISHRSSHRSKSTPSPLPPPTPSPPLASPSTSSAPKLPAPPPFWSLSSLETNTLVVSVVLKTLLFQAYHSTDFEVHRNWLAITHTLPLSQWYFDTTSEWTLDYPPFFAYFEKLLSIFAYIVDPAIVDLNNLGYKAWTAVAFQRSTVILSELVLVAGLFQWARRSQKPDYPTAFTIAASVIFHPGLLIVDHIHFQYNGMMLGILLWSIIAARAENYYACALLFATLLNFKHIFIYLSPPYLVFLFRRHCFSSSGTFQLDRLTELALIVLGTCLVSFGPFILAGGFSQIPQIISRLFPFQRGLNHAYWAANVWALVSAVDRVLVKYLISRGLPIDPQALISSSRGLIGSTTFGVLPNITPFLTFSITLSISFVYLTKLWFDPSYKKFLDSIILCGMTSFLWGWHVHEKAVLLFLIPLGLTAVEDDTHLRAYIVASCAGIYSLFPLLIKPAETPIKIIFSLLWCLLVFPSLRRVTYQPSPTLISLLISYAERLYIFGFFFLQLYTSFLHPLLFSSPPHWFWSPRTDLNSTFSAPSGGSLESKLEEGGAMEFLPLMLTSCYCAIGIGWSWLRLSWGYLWS